MRKSQEPLRADSGGVRAELEHARGCAITGAWRALSYADARAFWESGRPLTDLGACTCNVHAVMREVEALRAVYRAAVEWLDHLENAGGRYHDGVPGALMDAVEAYNKEVQP